MQQIFFKILFLLLMLNFSGLNTIKYSVGMQLTDCIKHKYLEKLRMCSLKKEVGTGLAKHHKKALH